MFQILLWYPWKGKKEYVPLRTAYSQDSRCGMQPKPSSLRAQAQLSETETETMRTETVETFELATERGCDRKLKIWRPKFPSNHEDREVPFHFRVDPFHLQLSRPQFHSIGAYEQSACTFDLDSETGLSNIWWL
ncbi:hypothetical protein TNCV_1513181 [Trichonephila clavipes]|nr:hypothetical protein TNCV_1513181 [Trichonephila clavipes]